MLCSEEYAGFVYVLILLILSIMKMQGKFLATDSFVSSSHLSIHEMTESHV